ncbi:MAG: extracellular solute-binding protein [Desulfobacca sp.]|uniref:extracellular solute-binding protein n=1 Tax=Desulfobacca sp. TaxID=2067990 RepID=UPI00404A03E0
MQRLVAIMAQMLLLICLLVVSGCSDIPEYEPIGTFSFVVDAQTRVILEQLQAEGLTPQAAGFSRNFIGIYVPDVFLPFEPFVLGLATESPIPTVLFLDAPWVRRYAASNWLSPLASTGIYAAEGLVPAVAQAFSFRQKSPAGEPVDELMGVPNAIKGNILFFRRDLLAAHQKTPPGTWDELRAVCQDILPREPSLKYGLIFHVSNFLNDFYPIFWGFGGRTHDDHGNFILLQPEMLERATAALAEICAMQGTITPGPAALPRFAAPQSLRQAFLRGEALFMINWNTRLHDLRLLVADLQGQGQAAIKSLDQVGVTAIPSQSGRPRKYSNIGSFGWAINRFAISRPGVIDLVSQFLNLVNSDRVQLLRAETSGEVPASETALAQVKNPDVRLVYEQIFASPTVILQPRPYNRKLNEILEKHLQDALFGCRTPAQAMQAAAEELRRHVPLD